MTTIYLLKLPTDVYTLYCRSLLNIFIVLNRSVELEFLEFSRRRYDYCDWLQSVLYRPRGVFVPTYTYTYTHFLSEQTNKTVFGLRTGAAAVAGISFRQFLEYPGTRHSLTSITRPRVTVRIQTAIVPRPVRAQCNPVQTPPPPSSSSSRAICQFLPSAINTPHRWRLY